MAENDLISTNFQDALYDFGTVTIELQEIENGNVELSIFVLAHIEKVIVTTIQEIIDLLPTNIMWRITGQSFEDLGNILTRYTNIFSLHILADLAGDDVNDLAESIRPRELE